MPEKNCCVVTNCSGRSVGKKGSKMEGDDHGQANTTQFLWKEGVKPSDIHRRLSEICEKKAAALTRAFNWVRTSISSKRTTQVVPQYLERVRFVESTGSSLQDRRDV